MENAEINEEGLGLNVDGSIYFKRNNGNFVLVESREFFPRTRNK